MNLSSGQQHLSNLYELQHQTPAHESRININPGEQNLKFQYAHRNYDNISSGEHHYARLYELQHEHVYKARINIGASW